MSIVNILLGVIAGGTAGYLWHRLVGCSGGGCPIVRNPYLSVIWGVLIGLLLTINK